MRKKKSLLKKLELLLLRCKITSAINQTKDWRRSLTWYQGGKKCECEKYQRSLIQKITGKECIKTNDRINTMTKQIINMRAPMVRTDAFDWTEDFDGFQETDGFQLYYNLKMVCDSGGAQTRTLREVAHFIRNQADYNLENYQMPKYFINILDGDQSSR